jgi:hypothetical protein
MSTLETILNVLILALEVWAVFFALFMAFICWLAWRLRAVPLMVQNELQELEDDIWLGFVVAREKYAGKTRVGQAGSL